MRRTEAEIGLITETCLELLRGGQETLDSVLARYPEHTEIVRPDLEAAVWLGERKHGLDPRLGFLSASRQRVIQRIQEESVSNPGRLRAERNGLEWSFWNRKLAVQLMTAMILIFILVIGSNSLALASSYAIPGDRLYSVKLTYEKVQLGLSVSLAGDAKLHIEYAHRRLQEIHGIILEERYEFLDKTITRYQDEVARAIDTLKMLASRDSLRTGELVALLKEVVTQEVVVLADLSGAATPVVKAAIEQALSISRAGQIALDELQDEIDTAQPPTPTTTLTTDALNVPSQTLTPTLLPTQPFMEATSPFMTFTPTPTQSVTMTPTPLFSSTATFTGTQTTTPTLTETPTPTGTTTLTATPRLTKTPRPTNTHRPTKKPTKTPKTPGAKESIQDLDE